MYLENTSHVLIHPGLLYFMYVSVHTSRLEIPPPWETDTVKSSSRHSESNGNIIVWIVPCHFRCFGMQVVDPHVPITQKPSRSQTSSMQERSQYSSRSKLETGTMRDGRNRRGGWLAAVCQLAAASRLPSPNPARHRARQLQGYFVLFAMIACLKVQMTNSRVRNLSLKVGVRV